MDGYDIARRLGAGWEYKRKESFEGSTPKIRVNHLFTKQFGDAHLRCVVLDQQILVQVLRDTPHKLTVGNQEVHMRDTLLRRMYERDLDRGEIYSDIRDALRKTVEGIKPIVETIEKDIENG